MSFWNTAYEFLKFSETKIHDQIVIRNLNLVKDEKKRTRPSIPFKINCNATKTGEIVATPNEKTVPYLKFEELIPMHLEKVVNIQGKVISIKKDKTKDKLVIVNVAQPSGKVWPVNFWRDETEYNPALAIPKIGTIYAFNGLYTKYQEFSASYFVKVIECNLV